MIQALFSKLCVILFNPYSIHIALGSVALFFIILTLQLRKMRHNDIKSLAQVPQLVNGTGNTQAVWFQLLCSQFPYFSHLPDRNIVMFNDWTTFDKCVIKWFCHYTNITECTYTNLGNIAHYTSGLSDIHWWLALLLLLPYDRITWD
jgi:hypothetical protein